MTPEKASQPRPAKSFDRDWAATTSQSVRASQKVRTDSDVHVPFDDPQVGAWEANDELGSRLRARRAHGRKVASVIDRMIAADSRGAESPRNPHDDLHNEHPYEDVELAQGESARVLLQGMLDGFEEALEFEDSLREQRIR